jgi:hypothetical protein
MTTTLKNTFGIEYEVNSISIPAAARALNNVGITCSEGDEVSGIYNAVRDGSVPNGCEVKTPIMTPDRLNETETVTAALRNAGGNVNGTNTGLHIHLGVKEWELNSDSRYNFVMNYYGIHAITSSLVAPSRLNNRYCNILNRGNADDMASMAADGRGYDRTRYASLNTQSIDEHGTFEVRLHQGSLNPKKINAWLSYNAALVLVAKDGLNIADIVPMWSNKTVDKDNAIIWLNYLAAEGYLEGYNRDYLISRILTLNP